MKMLCISTRVLGKVTLSRGVDMFARVGGLGYCCVYICGYSPLKIQCTAIILDRMNGGASAPLAPPLSTPLLSKREHDPLQYKNGGGQSAVPYYNAHLHSQITFKCHGHLLFNFNWQVIAIPTGDINTIEVFGKIHCCS